VGAIAEAIVAYAQPLIDQTDGSVDAMNRAMTIAQACWNLALLPEDRRDGAIDELKPALEMTDAEFSEFRQYIILPMIQRQREMFPGMHARSTQVADTVTVAYSAMEKYPGTGRNNACPCGSGRKYKRCCGMRK
jgi:uncharacterized protein YecA (UPF0149 family)